MKKSISFLVMFLMTCMIYAATVPMDEAKKLATGFYNHYSPVTAVTSEVINTSMTEYKSVPTYYTFNFSTGGFVLMAADDACIPILAYSFEGTMPDNITNPALQEWLDGYNQGIYQIIDQNMSNNATLREWNDLRMGIYAAPERDVNPLLTTTWDQGCYYNAMCPSDPSAVWSCGRVYTGCVATAMAQIMKFHNFPPQGVGSHSYTHPDYGVQTADFGNTTYNWASMPNNVTGSNTAVATLMYHAGVSVNMQYAPDGSGAFSEDVPPALLDYFNYHPDVTIKYKSDYSNIEDWKDLLRADLDNGLPIYYSGQGSGGHAFVCDGYRMSDSKFHFNWGWSGSSNGWYAIGSLNPGGSNFNDANSVVVHIKPFNPNLITRILHPAANAVIGVGYPVEIAAATVRGTPVMMKLVIDNIERFSTANDSLVFVWNTTTDDLGSHEVYVYSYTATDTSFYRINLNVAEWITQSSGFTTAGRGISYMSAVDSNIVWASGFDSGNPTGACSDFTRTTDGGTTWVPGVITNTTGLAQAMIFAMNSNTAYVPMYKVSGNKPQGIYVTTDGGATWAKQTTALFTNTNSFPNCVHFFNATDGWCMGDPINGEFEMYTTTDAGNTWTVVGASAIPNPTSGEFGVVGYYSAVNDSLWFGTNMGRVYRSPDKGHTWNVSTVNEFNGKYIKPTFRNGSHGLVQDKDQGTTGAICETFDGGVTWTPVTTTGPTYSTDLSYIPGTENTWVSTGSAGNNGTSYSFDGGHTWSDFIGTQGAEYMQQTWVNNHCGWAGGVSITATDGGTYRYIGLLMPPLPPPINLIADATGYIVHLTWEQPLEGPPDGYNVYRDGVKLTPTIVTALNYDDNLILPGTYEYCVKAVYGEYESVGECEVVDVAVSVPQANDMRTLNIYPNPANDHITLTLPEAMNAANVHILIYDMKGIVVRESAGVTSKITVDVSDLPAGLYFIRATDGQVNCGGKVRVDIGVASPK